MNLSTFFIDNHNKNLEKSIRKTGGILCLCLLFSSPFSFLSPCPLYRLPRPSSVISRPWLLIQGLSASTVWAKTSNSQLQILHNNSQKLPSETSEKSQPSGTMDLLQEKLVKEPDQVTYQSGTFVTYMLKAGFSLVVVLAIIVVISYLLKKYYLKGNLFGGKFIHLLDTCHLGAKKSLALIRVENQTLLLGITHQQINFLSQISLSEKNTTENQKGTPSSHENFSGQLSEKFKKLEENQPTNSTTSIAHILEDRFKGLKKI